MRTVLMSVFFMIVVTLYSSVYAQTSISSCPYTASSSGNYVVINDLTVSGTCITANVDNVTIDLQEHTLTGDGTGTGIYSNGGGFPNPKNLIIMNGTITGFNYGILTYGQGVLLSKLHVLSNVTDGINLTDFATLNAVESSDNGARGAAVGGHTLIIKSWFNDNGGLGLQIDGSSQLIDSDVNDNGGSGVDLGSQSQIINSNVSHNANIGVNVVCPGIVVNNAIRRNTTNLTTSDSTCLLFDNVTSP